MQLESGVARYYYIAKSDEERKNMVSTATLAVILFSFIVLISLFFLSDFISVLLFKTNDYSFVIIIACLTIPLSNLTALFTVVIQYKKKPLHYLVFQLIQIGITVISTLYLILYLKIGIIAVFWGQVLGFFFGTISMGIYIKKELGFILDFENFKKMIRYSFPLVPAVFGSLAGSYLNRFIMVAYLSLTEIALYAVALKLASLFQLVGTAFKMAWGPFLWETFENNPNHRTIFQKIQKEFSVIAIILVLLVALIAKELISWFATDEYVASAPLLGLLSLSVAISYIIMPVTGIGPGITKKTEYNTLIYFISLIVNIATLFLFLPHIGLIAVPISMLLGNITLLGVGWYNSEKLYFVGFVKAPMIISLSIAIIVLLIDYKFELSLLIRLSMFLILMIYLAVRYHNQAVDFIKKKQVIN